MKIAVISDIHGNMEALREVIKDINEQGCSKIYCLGDYVMAGPEPVATLDYITDIASQLDITLIQGNTDSMIANYSDEIYNAVRVNAPVMAEALKYDVNLLSDSQKAFLRELPPKKETIEEGVKILLVHGSPRKNNEDILPDTPLSKVEEMLSGVDADLILCGHTHIPCGFQTTKKQTVINVGSVGRPFTEKPESCYLALTIHDGKCLFEHRFVKYDNKTAAEKLVLQSFAGSDRLAQTLLNPKERHF